MSSADTVPDNANSGCVGPTSEQAGKADACAGCPNQSICASGEAKKIDENIDVKNTMSKVENTILVLSGKGGVGKSTFSAQLAFGLAKKGNKVGLLDVDICGPSIPLMLGIRGQEVHQSASGWSPVYVDVEPEDETVEEDDCELAVMSIGFLIPDPDSAIIWRGPKKNGLIEQFFTTVDWGDLDYLIVDTPPGTSDEHISVVQLLKRYLKPTDGAVVVTTPQEVSMMDVRKELNFCKQTNLNVLGVVENMSTMTIPINSLAFVHNETGADATQELQQLIADKCPELLSHSIAMNIFPPAGGGPKAMAEKFDVPFLGKLPMDPSIQKAAEAGSSLSKSFKPLQDILNKLIRTSSKSKSSTQQDEAGIIYAN
mmetsp:Transcript_9696/g.11640  ORF Transcript_9696/g.11640 Transcript_9696/m.11640 type:complete len:370 (+) Transcript_9696:123-1232(+)